MTASTPEAPDAVRPAASTRPAPAGPDQRAYPPIGDYALLSDCHSAALVSRDGSIDWCCFHRFDARPVFARLLDWSGGGHFRIALTRPATISRRYLSATNVLETRFTTPSGVLTVVDCLAIRRGPTAGDAAQTRSHHQLLRLVRCDAGQVQVTVEFAPRFDYGLTVPRLELHGDDLGVVYGGADALVLQSQIPLTQTEVCGCQGTITMRAGDQAFLALTHQPPRPGRPASTAGPCTPTWPRCARRSSWPGCAGAGPTWSGPPMSACWRCRWWPGTASGSASASSTCSTGPGSRWSTTRWPT